MSLPTYGGTIEKVTRNLNCRYIGYVASPPASTSVLFPQAFPSFDVVLLAFGVCCFVLIEALVVVHVKPE